MDLSEGVAGKGIVNISTDSLWNLKTSSTNAQLLQVGVLGKGQLNITTGGIVKARDTQIALNDKSKGDVGGWAGTLFLKHSICT